MTGPWRSSPSSSRVPVLATVAGLPRGRSLWLKRTAVGRVACSRGRRQARRRAPRRLGRLQPLQWKTLRPPAWPRAPSLATEGLQPVYTESQGTRGFDGWLVGRGGSGRVPQEPLGWARRSAAGQRAAPTPSGAEAAALPAPRALSKTAQAMWEGPPAPRASGRRPAGASSGSKQPTEGDGSGFRGQMNGSRHDAGGSSQVTTRPGDWRVRNG